QPTSAQTKDRPAGCAADSAAAGGRPVSSHLDAECGEPGPETTAVASSPHGANQNASDESVAGGGLERRAALEEEVVARTGAATAGIISPGAVGKPSSPRSVAVVGSTESNHPRTDAGDRTGSREVSGSKTAQNPSWGGSFDGAGIRAH